ncbi:MAG: hypothetical protein ACPGOY_16360 [Rhodospirillaceae bacterium]
MKALRVVVLAGVLGLVAGCSNYQWDPWDTVGRSVAGLAKSACASSPGTCGVSCPNGSSGGIDCRN